MKIRLKQDWVIPAGTEFERIDGLTRAFWNGNYEARLSTSTDTTASVYIDVQVLKDRPELFEQA